MQTNEEVKNFRTDGRVEQVLWSSKLPGIFSVTTEKSKVEIY